jgi:hypothetical protein
MSVELRLSSRVGIINAMRCNADLYGTDSTGDVALSSFTCNVKSTPPHAEGSRKEHSAVVFVYVSESRLHMCSLREAHVCLKKQQLSTLSYRTQRLGAQCRAICIRTWHDGCPTSFVEFWNRVILAFRQHVIWPICRGVLFVVPKLGVSPTERQVCPCFVYATSRGIIPILAANGASLSSRVEHGLPLSDWLF